MLESRAIGSERDVRDRLGSEEKPLGRTTLWRLLRDDKSFPKPFCVGGRRRWFLDEIESWKATRPRRQYSSGDMK